MEQQLANMVEGRPVPTRTELFIDFGINVSHTILRLRLARPDLYEEYKRLEDAAMDAAQQRIADVIRVYWRNENKAMAIFRGIAAEYRIGEYTLRRLRKQARGGAPERAAWDWKRIQRFISQLIKEKDPTLLSVAQMAQRIGPEYHRKTNGNVPTTQMSSNTLTGQLRQYPHIHKALLKLCAANRKRAKKETK